MLLFLFPQDTTHNTNNKPVLLFTAELDLHRKILKYRRRLLVTVWGTGGWRRGSDYTLQAGRSIRVRPPFPRGLSLYSLHRMGGGLRRRPVMQPAAGGS